MLYVKHCCYMYGCCASLDSYMHISETIASMLVHLLEIVMYRIVESDVMRLCCYVREKYLHTYV